MAPHTDVPSSSPLIAPYTDRLSSLTLGPPPSQTPSDASSSGSSFGYESLDSPELDTVCGTVNRPLTPGIYVPTVAFFDKITEDIDLITTARHVVRLARAGVAGLATQGSNGEAVHLSRAERRTITRATRKALDDAGFHHTPIIVGCGAQSTRETIKLCTEAQQAGGDYALVLPPAYYRPSFNAGSVGEFFKEVASASPIPILIYNYPGAVAGFDMDSDSIIALSKHPNIVGCKLTCGNTGKLNRIAATTQAMTPSSQGSGFMCLGGSTDFTLQTLIGGGSGIIGGMANIAPKTVIKLINSHVAGDDAEAQRIQAIVARGDWAAIKGGIVGTKSAMQTYFGYGGYGRKPLPRPTQVQSEQYAQDFHELVALEKSL